MLYVESKESSQSLGVPGLSGVTKVACFKSVAPQQISPDGGYCELVYAKSIIVDKNHVPARSLQVPGRRVHVRDLYMPVDATHYVRDEHGGRDVTMNSEL